MKQKPLKLPLRFDEALADLLKVKPEPRKARRQSGSRKKRIARKKVVR
jgi:hypothetical protein